MKNEVWMATEAAALDTLDMLSDTTSSALLAAKVMMVDDEPLMTDIVTAHLEDAGYRNFVVTNNPHEALALVRREDPGVLLLDLMMPGLSGFEVLEALRADRELRYTPVIVLTAATSADAKLRALQLGASDFLSKPVDASELALRVRNTLAFHQYHRRASQFDPATELPTGKLFERGMAEVLARRQAVGGVVALFSVLAPECRQLSESIDLATADHLALTLAQRLTRLASEAEALRPERTAADRAPRVARLSTERFALLVEGLRSAEAVEQLARQLQTALSQPVQLGQHELAPAVCLGVAMAPADGDCAQTLRQSADLAASHAQAQGRNQVGFATPELGARSLERLRLGAQLRLALRRQELVLHYQPKVNVRSNRIIGVEALVRWQHPELGLVPPIKFIPLAEELGLIEALGQWVLEQACQDAAAWAAGGLGRVKVAVNVAKPQFDSGRLCAGVRQALFDSGLPARQLVLELTESMLMDDVAGAITLMHELKNLGLTLSIDDFGTGYSSLAYLKRFPLDELKIDRSFIMDLPGELTDLAIVRSVVELGHSLGMTVIAEGVETAEQLACLRQLSCDTYQGYYFSRPVPVAEFSRMLAESDAARQAALAASRQAPD